MPEPAEFHDPMPELIETIIRTMGGGATTAGIARRLLAVIEILDQTEGTLRAAERSFTSAAANLTEVEAAGAPQTTIHEASVSLCAAIQALTEAREQVSRYLESLGAQAPAIGTAAHAPDTATSGKTFAPALDAYLKSLRILLPEPVDVGSAAAEAQDLCESLAIIATVMATLANLVTGPINVAAQKVARSIGKPLAAAGMELALAAAKEITGGTLPPELAGQLSAERVLSLVLGHVSPGTPELKITAFVLRLTGVTLCLASGRPVTRCPCYPDLVADTGTSVLGLPRPE